MNVQIYSLIDSACNAGLIVGYECNMCTLLQVFISDVPNKRKADKRLTSCRW